MKLNGEKFAKLWTIIVFCDVNLVNFCIRPNKFYDKFKYSNLNVGQSGCKTVIDLCKLEFYLRILSHANSDSVVGISHQWKTTNSHKNKCNEISTRE